jgi:hypothetical protein
VADPDLERRARVGLCVACVHARLIETPKGSEFWLCEKAKSDPRFAKYPALPVRSCVGFSRSP